jgi:hypothetical protein
LASSTEKKKDRLSKITRTTASGIELNLPLIGTGIIYCPRILQRFLVVKSQRMRMNYWRCRSTNGYKIKRRKIRRGEGAKLMYEEKLQ